MMMLQPRQREGGRVREVLGVSPESEQANARRFALAEAMQRRAQNAKPIQHPLEGMANLSDRAFAGLHEIMANRKEKQRNEALASVMTRIYDGDESALGELAQFDPGRFGDIMGQRESQAAAARQAQAKRQHEVDLLRLKYQLMGAHETHKVGIAPQKKVEDIDLDGDGVPELQRDVNTNVVSTVDTRSVINNTLSDVPEIKKDHRIVYDEKGRVSHMELIPGSKTAMDQAKELDKLENRTEAGVVQNVFMQEEIQNTIAQLDEDPFWRSGLIGQVMSNVGGTGAYDLSQRLATLQTNIALDRLDEMRQNSPTGGALGNVSDPERKALEKVRGSLEQAQSPSQLRGQLVRLDEMVTRYIHGQPEEIVRLAKERMERMSPRQLSQVPKAQSLSEIQPGYIEDGMVYVGGSPSKETSWRALK